MASTYDVRLDPKARTKKTTLDSNGYVVVTYTDRYTISIDSGTSDNAETVEAGAQASGTPIVLPSIGDSFPSKANATCKDVNTRCLGITYYESTVTYVSPSFQDGGGGGESDPTELPAKVRFFTAYEDREIDNDYDGNVLENPVSHELYSLQTEQADLGATITKSLSSFDQTSIYLFSNKVSTDSFLGFLPGTAKIHSIEAETARQGDINYWAVTVQVLFREPGPGGYLVDGTLVGDGVAEYAWYQRVIRKGLYAMTTAATPVKHRIGLKADGSYGAYPSQTTNAISTRVMLNENDEILNEDPTDNNTPIFDLKKTKGTIPFSSLGLF